MKIEFNNEHVHTIPSSESPMNTKSILSLETLQTNIFRLFKEVYIKNQSFFCYYGFSETFPCRFYNVFIRRLY